MIDLPYERQLQIKHERLTKLLSPYGKVEDFLGMEKPDHYRCKVHAVFAHDKRRGIVSGTYQEGTHKVVPVSACLLEDQRADAIIQTIRKLLPSCKIKTYDEDTGTGLLRHVLIRIGRHSGQILVVLVLADQVLPSRANFVKALREAHPEITSIVLNVNRRRTSLVLGDQEKPIYGPGFIHDSLCGMTFRISARSFYQVNPVQTEVLYGKAMELAGLTGKETVLDAYCGVGTIGILAAPYAGRVIGVERNGDAVRDASANARDNGIGNISFYKADAADFMTRYAAEGKEVDVVFMDPPRSGASPVFLKALLSLSPRRIVYISCGPDSLARDLKKLTGGGYQVRKIVPVDMFPFTEGIETVCLIEKL